MTNWSRFDSDSLKADRSARNSMSLNAAVVGRVEEWLLQSESWEDTPDVNRSRKMLREAIQAVSAGADRSHFDRCYGATFTDTLFAATGAALQGEFDA